MSDTTHIVLVGAGHAHLHVAAHADRLLAAGARVTLVSPDAFWYSGMATGMLGGDYTPSDDRLDPQALIERAGGDFMRDRMVGLDRQHRRVRLASGESLAYDLLSFNLGSRVAQASLPGLEAAEGVWPVKPIAGLWQLRERLESALAGTATPPPLAVIGGGPTGVEVTANLLGLSERYGRPLDVSLISSERRLLAQAPRGAGAWVTRRLQRRGARLELAANALAYRQGHVVLDDGSQVAARHVILATGLAAPDLVGELGLPHHPHHGLAITPALHSPGDDRLFAVGDCAWLRDTPYPKLGVFGVRQGPVLLDNLVARLAQTPLTHFHPQSRYLSILNLGDGRGLAMRGSLWWAGRMSLKLKRRLDHRFMAQYR